MYHPSVGPKTVDRETNDWTELDRAILELVAPLLRAQYELSDLIVPSVEHELEISSSELLVGLLHEFKLFEGSVT